jgi:hypothetical protein
LKSKQKIKFEQIPNLKKNSNLFFKKIEQNFETKNQEKTLKLGRK